MEDVDQLPEEMPNFKHTGLIAGGISIGLILIIILQHTLSFQKKSQTIIPAGNTYLGPPRTDTPAPAASATPIPTETVVPKKDQPKGSTQLITGKKYPYSFRVPNSMKLTTFPNDPYDIYAIVMENRPADQNVLIGVDDLSRSDKLKQFITLSKRSYVETWWKQFGGLKGVASIVEFTNSQGLKGYRAKYLNSSNQSPNDDIFFETPDTKYVIHLASGSLEPSVFNAIVDSVSWKK